MTVFPVHDADGKYRHHLPQSGGGRVNEPYFSMYFVPKSINITVRFFEFDITFGPVMYIKILEGLETNFHIFLDSERVPWRKNTGDAETIADIMRK